MPSTYLIPADVVFTDLSGSEGREGVLLNVATRRYYSLNETGLAIYERLVAGDDAAQAARHLVAAYGIELQQAEASVARLIETLMAAKLLQDASGQRASSALAEK